MYSTIQTDDRQRRAWIWVILPLLVYTAVAVTMTWPLARYLGTRAAGAGYGDIYEMTRLSWEAKEHLLAGDNPLHQTHIAYPDGITSRVMWATPLRWVPVMLLAVVLPPVAAFNLWLIVTLVLNGLTAYWLGMALTQRYVPAALLGGLVFTAFPTLQGHLSVTHLDVLALYGLPLFALSWWRMLFTADDVLYDLPFFDDYHTSWRAVIWGGVWFAVAGLGMVSQIIYTLMPLVLFTGLYALIARRQRITPWDYAWHQWPLTRAVAMVALGGLILLVFFGPLLTPAGRAEIDQLEGTGRVAFSTDLLAFASPSPFGPLDDLGLVPDYARDVLGTNSAEGSAYLGLVVLALAVVALLAQRSARPWLLLALGAMLFSLGPLLQWHNEPVVVQFENFKSYVTLPWAAVQALPVVSETRTPGRFNIATALASAALASIGARAVLRLLRSRGARAGVTLLLGVVILLEYQLFWPYDAFSAAQPDYFKQLAQRDDVDAVYNVPAQASTQMQAMAQQLVHEKPLIAGQLTRRSPQDPALLAVLDRALLGPTGYNAAEGVLPPIPADAIPPLLHKVGADRVILHKRFVRDAAGAVERLRGALGEPEFEDAQIAVFAVPSDPGAVPAGLLVAQELDEWSDPVPLDAFTGAFMDADGSWQLYSAGATYGELVIPAQGYMLARKIAVRLDGDLLAGVWAEPDASTVSIPLWLDAGFHTLEFAVLEGCTSYPFTPGCLGDGDCRREEPPQCISVAFGAPTWQAAETDVTTLETAFAHGLRLRGYDLQLTDDPRAVRVRLFWDAPDALPESYALFVHLTQPDDPAPLAQHADYPAITTDAWDDGAVWVSDAVIALGDAIPPGDYAINVGWFDPDTGERLAVEGDGPLAGAGIARVATVTIE